MRLRRMLNALFLAGLASVLIYAVMIALSDGPAVADALRGLSPAVFVAALLLSVGCFAIRAFRWRYLMRLSGCPVSYRDALYLQLAGQTMTISPGRIGEIVKPWLARETSGLPFGNGVALVFVERVADLIAVCILSLGGLTFVGGGTWTVAGALVLVAAGTAVAGSAWFHGIALRITSRQAWLRDHHASLGAVSETIRTGLAFRTLLPSVVASVLAWGLEGVGLAICLAALGFTSMGGLAAVSVYAVSTLVGALTFLPGGLGVTEASLAGILIAAGLDAPSASAATVVIRVSTLWWGVGLGWVALLSRPSLLRRLVASVATEDAPVTDLSASSD